MSQRRALPDVTQDPAQAAAQPIMSNTQMVQLLRGQNVMAICSGQGIRITRGLLAGERIYKSKGEWMFDFSRETSSLMLEERRIPLQVLINRLSNRNSPFFKKLPLEIRNMIYRYAAKEGVIEPLVLVNGHIGHVSNKFWANIGTRGFFWVCAEFYKEFVATLYIYKMNLFLYRDLSTFNHLLTLSLPRFNAITAIEITADVIRNKLLKQFKVLAACHGLQSLKIMAADGYQFDVLLSAVGYFGPGAKQANVDLSNAMQAAVRGVECFAIAWRSPVFITTYTYTFYPGYGCEQDSRQPNALRDFPSTFMSLGERRVVTKEMIRELEEIRVHSGTDIYHRHSGEISSRTRLSARLHKQRGHLGVMKQPRN